MKVKIRKQIRETLDGVQKQLRSEYKCDIVVTYRIEKPSDEQALKEYYEQASPILDSVQAATGFSIEALKSKSRKRSLVDARHIAIYLTRFNTTLSVIAIGRIFNRDHSTVLNSLNAYDCYLNRDDVFTETNTKVMAEFSKKHEA